MMRMRMMMMMMMMRDAQIAERDISLASQTKRYGDILKHVLPRMPTDRNQHRVPHMILQLCEIWRILWPLVFFQWNQVLLNLSTCSLLKTHI